MDCWRRFTEITSNLPKNKLELKDGRGKFKETAGRVCFQEILSDQSYTVFLEAKHASLHRCFRNFRF